MFVSWVDFCNTLVTVLCFSLSISSSLLSSSVRPFFLSCDVPTFFILIPFSSSRIFIPAHRGSTKWEPRSGFYVIRHILPFGAARLISDSVIGPYPAIYLIRDLCAWLRSFACLPSSLAPIGERYLVAARMKKGVCKSRRN